jgi:hypothetical protein
MNLSSLDMRHTALVLRDPCWRIEHPIGIFKREIFDGSAMISWASISGLF